MSSSESPSKRERQKQRREVKLAEQRAVEAKSRRNRLIAFALLGVVFAGLVGIAVVNKINSDKAEAQQEADAKAKLAEMGCDPSENPADGGGGHFTADELEASPPEVAYPDRPAATGKHFGNWIKTGVYDQLIDERALVHNLEHGYVLAYHDDDADEAQVTALKEYGEAQIDDDFKKLIVAPWDGELPKDKNFAYVGWGVRQMCEQFDADIFNEFLEANHGNEGVAPEKTLPAHLAEGNGTVDPKDEDFLLPPLGREEAPTGEASESGSEASSEAPAS